MNANMASIRMKLMRPGKESFSTLTAYFIRLPIALMMRAGSDSELTLRFINTGADEIHSDRKSDGRTETGRRRART